MRKLPKEFKERLNSSLNFLCRAWIITPKIGEIIRLCEFDKDIELNGDIFKSIDGLESGALQIQNSLGPDRTSISAALNAQGISREAVQLGHFNKARVESFIFDWQMPQFFVKIWEGQVARAILHDFGFEFELAGPETDLNKPIHRQFTRHCTAKLGDADCKIDLNATEHNFTASIREIHSLSQIEISPPMSSEISHFFGGEILFQSGIWTGYKARILSIEEKGNLFIKTEIPLPFSPQINDEIIVFKGCDKSLDCCKSRFQNQANFFGFPFLPGERVIYASP